MNNPLDLIEKAKEAIANPSELLDKAKEFGLGDKIDDIKEAIADKVENIPGVGDKIAGMLGHTEGASEGTEKGPEDEGTEESDESDDAPTEEEASK